MGAGTLGPAPESCQLKSCWCSNRDNLPVHSLCLPGVVPVVGSPCRRPVGATGPAQVSTGAPHLRHPLLGGRRWVERDPPVPGAEET